VRRHLTYTNLLSTIAVFLVVAGGTAFAASKLAKNSVGSKQLKANSVTAKKIKKNAVTKAKIKKGAVDGSKIADGSVTGTEIDGASTPFGRVVAKPESTQAGSLEGALAYPIGTFTKNANEATILIPSADITFSASCTPPRTAQLFLVVDAADPSAPGPLDIAALGFVIDESTGQVSRRMDFSPLPPPAHPLSYSGPSAGTHSFALLNTGGGCSGGSGVSITAGRVEVVGVK
jgi:hypothetical protein